MADYAPYPYGEPIIPHYWGDIIRQLFIVAAALMLVGAPFYADTLRNELPFEIVGALIVVFIASLANPHNKSVFMAGAVAAGVGFLVYELWALNMYFDSTWLRFILREVIAIIFLTAFYYNMKTVRAFVLHRVGKHDEVGEFEEPTLKKKEQTWRDEFIPLFLRNGGAGKARADEKREAPERNSRRDRSRSSEEDDPNHVPPELM